MNNLDEEIEQYITEIIKPNNFKVTKSKLKKELLEANHDNPKVIKFNQWKETNDKIKDLKLLLLASQLVVKRLQTGISTEDYVSELKRDLMLSRQYKDVYEKSQARHLKLVAENKRLRSKNVGDKLNIKKLETHNDLEARFTEVNSQRRDQAEEIVSLKERLQQYEPILES